MFNVLPVTTTVCPALKPAAIKSADESLIESAATPPEFEKLKPSLPTYLGIKKVKNPAHHISSPAQIQDSLLLQYVICPPGASENRPLRL